MEYKFEEPIPATKYMIVRNAEGKDVYKRRVVNKERVKKERPEGYHEEKEKALSERALRLSIAEYDTKEARHSTYENIFTKFANNY